MQKVKNFWRGSAQNKIIIGCIIFIIITCCLLVCLGLGFATWFIVESSATTEISKQPVLSPSATPQAVLSSATPQQVVTPTVYVDELENEYLSQMLDFFNNSLAHWQKYTDVANEYADNQIDPYELNDDEWQVMAERFNAPLTDMENELQLIRNLPPPSAGLENLDSRLNDLAEENEKFIKNFRKWLETKEMEYFDLAIEHGNRMIALQEPLKEEFNLLSEE
jgi:hypothetical protein